MNQRIQQAAKELLRREIARNNISDFCKFMQSTNLLDFKYPPAEHHTLILQELKKMLAGNLFKLAVSLPPGSAKSTYITVILPCYLLALFPEAQILCISNSESLAEGFARRRRAIFKSREWNLLSNTFLSPDMQALGLMGTPEGGAIYCAGAGSIITGIRCDWLISDDLVTGHEQANNLTQLDKIWNWYLSEARSRLKPNGREIILGTRWASQDPIGRALELKKNGFEKWEYIRIPMICDDSNDPLQRKLGDRLWPQWFTPEMVKEAQRSPQIWTTLYQQKPVDDEGSWVSFKHFHIKTCTPPNLRYVVGCDIAISEGRGDFTVFIVAGIDERKHIWVVDCYRAQTDTATSARELLNICKKYNPSHVFCDNDAASQVWSRLVAEIQRSVGIFTPLQLLKLGNKDKETRNSILRSYLLQDVIHILDKPWKDPLINELYQFPGGRHDDCVDALGLIARQLIKIPPPNNPLTRREHIPTSFHHYGNNICTTTTLEEMFLDFEKNKRNRGTL